MDDEQKRGIIIYFYCKLSEKWLRCKQKFEPSLDGGLKISTAYGPSQELIQHWFLVKAIWCVINYFWKYLMFRISARIVSSTIEPHTTINSFSIGVYYKIYSTLLILYYSLLTKVFSCILHRLNYQLLLIILRPFEAPFEAEARANWPAWLPLW